MCVKDKIKNKEIKIVDTTLRDGEQTAALPICRRRFCKP